MILNRATTEDFESIIAFYDDVTDRTPDIERFARWQKGKHPTAEGIRAYIEEGSMYLYKEDDVIVGAMAVTMYQGEDYHAIEWNQQVEDNKAAVIHILATEGRLPEKYHPHILHGQYEGYWECHITPDWLLTWDQNDRELVLLMTNTGTHSDLFGKNRAQGGMSVDSPYAA